MEFLRQLTLLEYALAAVGLLLYALFVVRNFLITKRMRAKQGNVWLKLPLRFAYVSLAGLALMGPGFGSTTQELRSIGKDLIVLVDVSPSMGCTDVAPTRLERAKNAIRQMATQFNNDKMGIIVYAAHAQLLCPLTTDQNSLIKITESIQPNMLPQPGTALAPALQLGMTKLLQEENRGKGVERARLLIVISDGEDYGADPAGMVLRANRAGVRTICLGIGGDVAAPVPGPGRSYLKENGMITASRLDKALLQNLARAGAGAYFEIAPIKTELAGMLNYLTAIEGSVRKVTTMDARADRYFYFLGVALFLMLGDVLFTVKLLKL